MSKITMSWSDRLALMERYTPTDSQACVAFGLTQDELDTARTLVAAGTFKPSTTVDFAKYSTLFTAPESFHVTATKSSGATSYARPESATKKPKVHMKRGRKGNKIAMALAAVPTTQVPITSFMNQHGISLAVLRQSKRFIANLDSETAASIGQVHVRQDKASKQLMIWRESVPKA
jgi:hypothetical protein